MCLSHVTSPCEQANNYYYLNYNNVYNAAPLLLKAPVAPQTTWTTTTEDFRGLILDFEVARRLSGIKLSYRKEKQGF